MKNLFVFVVTCALFSSIAIAKEVIVNEKSYAVRLKKNQQKKLTAGEKTYVSRLSVQRGKELLQKEKAKQERSQLKVKLHIK